MQDSLSPPSLAPPRSLFRSDSLIIKPVFTPPLLLSALPHQTGTTDETLYPGLRVRGEVAVVKESFCRVRIDGIGLLGFVHRSKYPGKAYFRAEGVLPVHWLK